MCSVRVLEYGVLAYGVLAYGVLEYGLLEYGTDLRRVFEALDVPLRCGSPTANGSKSA